MKKVNLLLLCFLAINFFSCSSNDDGPIPPEEDSVNKQEDELLEINAVTAGIVIDGATVKTGSPTPTGDIAFSLDYSKQSAFQTKGFEIAFETPVDFAGAYVQLKDENGMADSYYDIPLSAINGASGKSSNRNKKEWFGSSVSKVEDNTIINVNFKKEVTAGTFCYVICVYDGQGNISVPSDVCVTVEAWGGNSSLSGSWEFTKEVENGNTTNVGEEMCEEYNSSIQCANEESLEVGISSCYTTQSMILLFKNDGTYEFESTELDKSLDWEASKEDCSAIYEEGEEKYTSSGNWAFNEEEGRLTLVEFEWSETENGETTTETNEEGELSFDGKIVITGNSLKIIETDIYQGEEDIYEYFFDKK